MIRDEEYKRLREEHEIVFLKGDLATSMPDSYSIEEMREISEAMDASTQAIDDAMRVDFESLPSAVQAKLLDMLAGSEVESREWWEYVLMGFTVPDIAPEDQMSTDI